LWALDAGFCRGRKFSTPTDIRDNRRRGDACVAPTNSERSIAGRCLRSARFACSGRHDGKRRSVKNHEERSDEYVTAGNVRA
ncbi:MAG: hypothetical protein FWG79_09070, partial [Bacteroidales bacterium]|nr:hypothetical protein [Bacteroidales bacterium]